MLFIILLIVGSYKVNIEVMYEKQFNKQLLKAKRDAEDFENSIKYWICDNAYVDSDIKVRYHFH